MNDSLSKIRGWVIIECLGRGTSGIVYKAKAGERLVALKTPFLHPPAERTQRAARFRREAMSTAACHHPNIVATYSVGEDAGLGPYLTREFVDGVTLEQRATAPGLDIVSAVRMVRDVASAVVAIHRQGLIHRQLLPENVLVATTGEVKLIGFSKAVFVDLDLVLPEPVSPAIDVEALHAMVVWLCKTIKHPLEVEPPTGSTTAIAYGEALDLWIKMRKR